MQRITHWSLVAVATLVLGGMFCTAKLSAAGPAVSAAISPTTLTLTADQSQVLTVTATEAGGQTRDVTAETTFSTNDPVGSMSGATYHAGKVGTWTIQGVYQSFTVNATVTVTAGALKELVVNPDSNPEFVNIGSKKTFAVQGFDSASNAVTGFTPTWRVIGEIGTIDTQGVFTATTLGTGKVEVSANSVADETAVVVKEATVEPVANTNANTNTTVVQNTNTSTNTNTSASNSNVSTNSNTNTAPAATTSTNTLECKTLSNWVWILILIAWLVGVAILYALVPVTKVWPAVIALGGAIALVAIQRNYGCDILGWWSWVLSLGTLGMSVLALRQLPGPKPTNI